MRSRIVLLSVLLVTAPDGLSAQATEECTVGLERAEAAFAAGEFGTAIQLAQRCTSLPGKRLFGGDDTESYSNADERARAHELLAKTHLARDDTRSARESVEALLSADPGFDAADSEHSPRLRELVRLVVRELRAGATTAVSKSSERLLEAPATVTVITGEQIRTRGYVDLEEVLHDFPGFDISRPRGQAYSNIYQRGYRSEATDRTLLIVDGVEQNDLFTNTAFISRQYPLSNIERIEVVYGPASTMYGANAFLGVINVITRRPGEWTEEEPVQYDVHASTGPWNTRAFDGTVAGRIKDVSASLTGRIYHSDSWDASSSWDFDRSSPEATELYKTALFGLADRALGPQDLALIDQARTLDEQAYQGTLNGHPIDNSGLVRDWMVQGKLDIDDLKLGFQLWGQDEGTGSAGTSRSMPGGLNGNLWRPYQRSFYARYSRPLGGGYTLGYLGQAKVHGIGDGSARFRLHGYLDGPFGMEELEAGRPAFWSRTKVREVSNQMRNEINITFRSSTLSTILGFEVRNGSIQSNYEQVTDCVAQPGFFAGDREDPAAALQKIVDAVPGARENLSDRIVKILSGLSSSRCVSTPLDFDDNPAVPSGGHHYRVRDLGVFGQLSYSASDELRIVLGARLDDNSFDPNGGSGTVFSPRLAAVHTPGDYVLKAVYSEAFKAPSSAEQFSSVGSVRKAAENELHPERAKNLEFSIGRQTDRISIDGSVYRTEYTEALANVSHGHLLADRQVNDFLAEYAASGFGDLPIDDLSESLVQKLLFAPSATRSFRNLGGFVVWGVQLSASGRVGGVDLFGHYNYTNPKASGNLERYISIEDSRDRVRQALGGVVPPFVSGVTPESVPIADMSSHRLVAGTSRRWTDVDVALRANFIGDRRAGPGTTVSTNPLGSIQGHVVLNGSVSYRVAGGLTAQLTINNLLDATYWDPGNGVANGLRAAARVIQPGRSLFLRLLIGL